MKISEAMRLGAMIRPQAFGYLFLACDRPNFGDILGLNTERESSCALGAVFEAAGSLVSYTQDLTGFCMYTVPNDWALLFNGPELICPACDEYKFQLRGVIAHLNNDHRWTREHIADFVETIENLNDPATQGKDAERILETS